MDAMSNLSIDDMVVTRLDVADTSGQDLDLMGDGIDRPKTLMPDPESGQADCVLKGDDGNCPAACAACASFQLELSNWLRLRRMEAGD